MPARKCRAKTDHATLILRIERSTESAPCQHSRQRGTAAAVHDKITRLRMAGFDNPLETWNARFAREDFLFGE
jgi:hypothetical protein